MAAICRTHPGPKEQDGAVKDALRRLYSEELTTIEWLELTRVLVQPFANTPEAHPIPELVMRFAAPTHSYREASTPMQALLDELAETGALGARAGSESGAGTDTGAHRSAESALDRLLAPISHLLDDLSFLRLYPLVARSGEEVEVRVGTRRASPAHSSARDYDELGEAEVALTGPRGEVLLVLSPFCQILAPAPGTPEEIFLFDGPSRFGAKLVAFPVGFERHDDGFWPWFEKNVVELQPDADGEEDSAHGQRAPYMGLSAFSPEDADNYFGREHEVEACVNRLRINPLLAVVGPSGAGKSSFVQAGIIPALPASWRSTYCPARTLTRWPSSTVRPRTRRHMQAGRSCAQSIEADDIGRPRPGFAPVQAVDSGQDITPGHRPVRRAIDSVPRSTTSGISTPGPSCTSWPDDPQRPATRWLITLRDDFLVRAQQLPALCEIASATHYRS